MVGEDNKYLVIPFSPRNEGNSTTNPFLQPPEPKYVTEAELQEMYNGSEQTSDAFGSFDNYKSYVTQAQNSIESADWFKAEARPWKKNSIEWAVLNGEDLDITAEEREQAYYNIEQAEKNAVVSNFNGWMNSTENQVLLGAYGVDPVIYNEDGDQFMWTGNGYHQTVNIDGPNFADYAKMAITTVLAAGATYATAGAIGGALKPVFANMGIAANGSIATGITNVASKVLVDSALGYDVTPESIVSTLLTPGIANLTDAGFLGGASTAIFNEGLEQAFAGELDAGDLVKAALTGGAIASVMDFAKDITNNDEKLAEWATKEGSAKDHKAFLSTMAEGAGFSEEYTAEWLEGLDDSTSIVDALAQVDLADADVVADFLGYVDADGNLVEGLKDTTDFGKLIGKNGLLAGLGFDEYMNTEAIEGALSSVGKVLSGVVDPIAYLLGGSRADPASMSPEELQERFNSWMLGIYDERFFDFVSPRGDSELIGIWETSPNGNGDTLLEALEKGTFTSFIERMSTTTGLDAGYILNRVATSPSFGKLIFDYSQRTDELGGKKFDEFVAGQSQEVIDQINEETGGNVVDEVINLPVVEEEGENPDKDGGDIVDQVDNTINQTGQEETPEDTKETPEDTKETPEDTKETPEETPNPNGEFDFSEPNGPLVEGPPDLTGSDVDEDDVTQVDSDLAGDVKFDFEDPFSFSNDSPLDEFEFDPIGSVSGGDLPDDVNTGSDLPNTDIKFESTGGTPLNDLPNSPSGSIDDLEAAPEGLNFDDLQETGTALEDPLAGVETPELSDSSPDPIADLQGIVGGGGNITLPGGRGRPSGSAKFNPYLSGINYAPMQIEDPRLVPQKDYMEELTMITRRALKR